MAGKKISRKELVKKPDEFLTLTGKAIQWAHANAKPLAYGIGVFFTFIILVAGYRFYAENRERAAAALLSQGMAAYGEARQTGKNPSEALAAAQPDLERLMEKYGRYDAGRLGRVFLAHISLEGGAFEQAIAHYTEAMHHFKGDGSLHNAVLHGLGLAYLQKGDKTAATETFDQLAGSPGAAFKDAALFQLGQLHRSAGSEEKSRQVYERLRTDFPDSIYADMARELSLPTVKRPG